MSGPPRSTSPVRVGPVLATALALGTETRTDVHLVPTEERTLAVSTTCVKDRDTADVGLMLASLRPA